MTTPIGKGFRSLNLTLRKELGLYANVRPCLRWARRGEASSGSGRGARQRGARRRATPGILCPSSDRA